MNQEVNKESKEQPQKNQDKIKNLIEKVRPYAITLWGLRKKLLLFNFIVAAAAIAYLYIFGKPYFESTITILPEYGSKSTTLSGLSQLAALAGVRVGEGAPTEIYQNLLTSESVLEKVIYHEYQTEKFDKPVNLVQYILDDDTVRYSKRRNFLRVYKALSENIIKSSVERLTKILTVTVTMGESKLSAEVANQLAESLDLFVRTKRKTYASEQRFYLEKRTVQLKDSLSIAEDRLRAFREQNRVTVQSPRLLLEQGRLMRDIEILNAVYIELNKQLEIAKIDDIRETPIVNIKEWAKDPVIKAGPARLKSLIIIMFFSVVLSSLYYLFKPQLQKYYKMVRGKEVEAGQTPSD